MPTGPNTVATFAESLDDIRKAARTVREYANIMGQLVDITRLEDNTGLSYKEVVLQKLSASSIDDLTDLETNPQEIIDSLFTITPTQIGMSMFMSDRAKVRISKVVAAKLGSLMEHAMARKVDVDLIAIGQSATTDLGTAGSPMASDLVSAAVANIRGNTTEPWDGAIATVMKTFQLKDIQDEGVGGFGTYPTGGKDTLTEEFLRKGYQGPLYGSEVRTDDNISTDASDDSIAFVFASGSGGAIVEVTGMAARYVTVRKENIGGGAEIMYSTDEYGTGIRVQSWIRAVTSDASAPVA